MLRHAFRALCASVFVLMAGSAFAAGELRLTSLDWPPYSGKQLKDGGASVAVVRAALQAMDVTLKVEFLPWKRAVAMAKDEPGVAGYFPEYAEVEDAFTISPSIGISPLGFAERKGEPIEWTSLADLTRFQPIGIVDGYINEKAFDAAIAEGKLKADKATDDTLNLRKLAAGRVRTAVVDRHVMSWLLQHDQQLAPYRATLGFNGRLLEDKTLHVAFSNRPEGKAAKALLEQGLKRIDVERVAQPYLVSGLPVSSVLARVVTKP